MCGRFSLSASGEDLAEAFGLDGPPHVVPHYNIAPTQPVLIVRQQDGRRQAASLRWGLTGGGPEEDELLINARSETASTRAAFREAYRRRRCLVPADGFYEWKRGPDGPQPYHVRRRDGRVFAMAGLWSPGPRAAEEDGACVILTTEASPTVAPIHDRMPVIVPPEAYRLWLEAPPERLGEIEPLLRPFPEGQLHAVAVSPAVNSVANDSPLCQAPAPERPQQGLLFPEMDDR